jgi:2-polyprenyl-3-methyl-5-hydroxy-6-metoxy-1,4-benzoquinol methylase
VATDAAACLNAAGIGELRFGVMQGDTACLQGGSSHFPLPAAANPGAIAQAAAAQHQTVLIYDPFYPKVGAGKIKEGLDAYFETKASFLECQNRKGQVCGALHISAEFPELPDVHNSFVLMLDVVEALRTEDEAAYRALQKKDETELYSSEEQKSLAEEFMDNIGDHYGHGDLEDPVLVRSARDVPQRVSALTSITHGKKVLDIGCSAGVITLLLARDCDEIVGVDIVPDLIGQANDRRAKEPEEIQKRVSFICQDIASLDFEPGHFDSIFLTEFYEHLPHVAADAIMKQTLKYLAEDGTMIISVPNRYPKQAYVDEERHRWDWYNHLTHFTRRSLELFVRKHFNEAHFVKIYPEDSHEEGVWLVCVAKGKKS